MAAAGRLKTRILASLCLPPLARCLLVKTVSKQRRATSGLRHEQFPADWAIVACRKDMSPNHWNKSLSVSEQIPSSWEQNYSTTDLWEARRLPIGVPSLL